jgi:hypothetical protein
MSKTEKNREGREKGEREGRKKGEVRERERERILLFFI